MINLSVGSCQALSSHVGSCQSQTFVQVLTSMYIPSISGLVHRWCSSTDFARKMCLSSDVPNTIWYVRCYYVYHLLYSIYTCLYSYHPCLYRYKIFHFVIKHYVLAYTSMSAFVKPCWLLSVPNTMPLYKF